MHLAEWKAAAVSDDAEAEWRLLREVRDAVNAVLEPMRAAKTLAGTAEAEVVLHVPPAMAARLEPYASELAGFLIVARARVVAASGDAIRVEAFEHGKRCHATRSRLVAIGTTSAQSNNSRSTSCVGVNGFIASASVARLPSPVQP